MNPSEIKSAIVLFPKQRILVVGDAMIDMYVEGDVEHISAEAPVPIVRQRSVRFILGGAGNVAANARALGGITTLVAIAGRDTHAKTLRNLCERAGIHARLITDAKRPTTTKLRIISHAHQHQLARLDSESAAPIGPETEKRLIAVIRALPPQDIVIVSDYAKGCITKNVIKLLKEKFGPERIVADMKPQHAPFYKGIYAITPNMKEAAALTGIHTTTDALAARATDLLVKRLSTNVILTRAEHGVTLREKRTGTMHHFRSRPLSVKDVTGAGDTLIAALALMRAVGAPLPQATEAANLAAGIAVSQRGTVALSHKELVEHLDTINVYLQ